jgi:hypothetical protein
VPDRLDPGEDGVRIGTQDRDEFRLDVGLVEVAGGDIRWWFMARSRSVTRREAMVESHPSASSRSAPEASSHTSTNADRVTDTASAVFPRLSRTWAKVGLTSQRKNTLNGARSPAATCHPTLPGRADSGTAGVSSGR